MLASLVLAGCGGGDDEPTAEERRAAKARWIERADAACQKANDAIAERGWPIDLVDLDRLVVRGIDDVRTAITTITRLKIPEGAGPDPARLVRELKALEGQLAELSETSEELEAGPLIKAADGLKPRLFAIEKVAARLGLRDCATHGERQFVPDAVRGPVFAQQLAKLDRSLLRRIKRIDFRQAETPDQLATMFKRYSGVIDSAIAGIGKLDPPSWAAPQTAGYEQALIELQSATQEVETVLEVEDRSEFIRADRELQKAAAAEIKARRRMIRALGASPTTPAVPEEEAAPEGEEVA